MCDRPRQIGLRMKIRGQGNVRQIGAILSCLPHFLKMPGIPSPQNGRCLPHFLKMPGIPSPQNGRAAGAGQLNREGRSPGGT